MADPAALPIPSSSIIVETDDPDVVEQNDSGISLELPDGSVVIDLSPPANDNANSKFDTNLATTMQSGALSAISEQLIEGIEADLQSRTEWEATRNRGIELLGLKLEEPRSDIGSSSAPLEGMSTVRDSTLLEAVLQGQANAIGELLPADGPVKIEDTGAETTDADELAEAFEKDMNDTLTNEWTEYYPDTKRMLFWTYAGGSGWKKVYHDPIRRRPTSESVDANDLIVSNAATDLWSAGRVTHRMKMRPSVMKRMQLLGAYRDVSLGQPSPQTNRVDEQKDSIEGVRTAANTRPEDQPHTLYECYCELDLDEFAPKQFKGKGIPLPYRVTIDKDSREILDVHRNWKEDDESCLPRKYFVRYPFVEGMGLYGIGYFNILGNTSTALTAAQREMLDTGMFANFPGFIVAKAASRQLTNEMRVPPGGAVVIDAPNGDVTKSTAPLPYKDVGAGLMGLMEFLQQAAQRLGGTANQPIAEGKQDAPVGTTLALIEQATKIESAVHKGLHHAQAEEFQLIKERFREDPEAFWRNKPKSDWNKETFLAALDRYELVPVADPNTPSHMHRLMKAQAVLQLAQLAPTLFDLKAVASRFLSMIKVDDADSLFAPQNPNPQPDPNAIAAQAKLIQAQASQGKNAVAAQGQQLKATQSAADNQSQETIQTTKLAEALVAHSNEADQANKTHALAATDSAHNRVMDINEALTQPPPAPAGAP